MAVAGPENLPLIYDDVYTLCSDREGLNFWLRERGLIGNFLEKFAKSVIQGNCV